VVLQIIRRLEAVVLPSTDAEPQTRTPAGMR